MPQGAARKLDQFGTANKLVHPSLSGCRFQNGALGTFEATRYARGHKALNALEINGEHASAMWDLHDLHRIQYFDHRDEGQLRGWRNIHVTDGEHPYMRRWWFRACRLDTNTRSSIMHVYLAAQNPKDQG